MEIMLGFNGATVAQVVLEVIVQSLKNIFYISIFLFVFLFLFLYSF